MKSGNGAQIAFRTSAAVLAMFWLGHGAIAQEADAEEPVEFVIDPIEYVEDGSVIDGEAPTEEELLSDGIGDGLPLDGEVTVEEPVFVSSCGGCELEFVAGGPEVQRDGTPTVVTTGASDGGSDTPIAHSGGNACDEGALSKMWICTVQNGSWRD